jgi:hypothetical protein
VPSLDLEAATGPLSYLGRVQFFGFGLMNSILGLIPAREDLWKEQSKATTQPPALSVSRQMRMNAEIAGVQLETASPQSQPTSSPPQPAEQVIVAQDIEGRFSKLERLFKKNLISQSEYDKKRAEILSEL